MKQATGFPSILRTKLYRPPVYENWVDRPHLLERLDAGRRRPSTPVSASAGYGKTILVGRSIQGKASSSSRPKNATARR